MLKKIMPYIVVVVLLAVVQGVLAEDWYDNPQPKLQFRQFQNPWQGRRGFQGGQKQLGQRFDKWLDELTNAYKNNDKEKMGELIEKMHQRRETMRQRRGTRSEFRPWLRRRGYGQRGRVGQFRGGQYGYGRGFQGRNVDGRGCYGFQRRHTYGWGQSRPHRRMGRDGRYYQYPDLQNPQQDSGGFNWDW
ncbi:MAG: hypothetical protein DRP62_01455 [Planctomycetota bacterium]|nr:MAG: hypothetical protein DRP62_01455 [Planctomycetota bacterium]